MTGTAQTLSGNTGTAKLATASCTGGKVAFGGGGQITGGSGKVALDQSYPSSTTTWTVEAIAVANSASATVTAYVICGNP